MGQGGSLVPVLTPGRLFCLLAERRDGRIPFVIQDDDHTVTGELDASAVIAMVSFVGAVFCQRSLHVARISYMMRQVHYGTRRRCVG